MALNDANPVLAPACEGLGIGRVMTPDEGGGTGGGGGEVGRGGLAWTADAVKVITANPRATRTTMREEDV